jgi:hypothetical protein
MTPPPDRVAPSEKMRTLLMLQEQKLGEERMIWEVRTVKTGTNLPSCGRLYLTSPSDHASPSKNMQVLFLLTEQKLDKE